MAAVNAGLAGAPDHLAYLLHMATRRLRAEAEAASQGSEAPLQAAQARLLDLIPPSGGRVTDLAAAMRISKQGLGQVATQLADMGCVDVLPDPADKRAKLVRRTSRGDDIRQAMRATIAQVQQRWCHEVGPERYTTFHDVLLELVHGSPTISSAASALERRDRGPT